MTLKAPDSFATIAQAFQFRGDRLYNVVGIVTDYLPPARSRGPDLTMKLTLWDMSCGDVSTMARSGMIFRLFYKQESCMPPVHDVGDVLVLQNVKTLAKDGQPFGVSNHKTQWVVVPRSNLDINDGRELKALDCRMSEGNKFDTSLILKYIRKLSASLDPSLLQAPPKATSLPVSGTITHSNKPGSIGKFRLVEDLEAADGTRKYIYVDLLVELRKIWDANNPIELKVTDYTENELLYNYTLNPQLDGDEFGYINPANDWVGPWGKRTIQVALWDEHAAFIREVISKGELQLGSFLQIQNVQIKMNKMDASLEGHCRGAAFSSQKKIAIMKPHQAESNPHLKALLERKRKYERQAKEENLSFQNKPEAKRSHKVDIDMEESLADLPTTEAMDAKQKRRQKNKARKRAKKAHKGGNAEGEHEMGVADRRTTWQSNNNVRCEAIEIPLTSIRDILDKETLKRSTPQGNSFYLPFQNCKFRSRVQVIDFFPDKLEDFATPREISDYDVLSDQDSGSDSDVSLSYARTHSQQIRWHWHFFIWVRDPRPSLATDNGQSLLVLQVADQDAEYLLNTEACDLRGNPKELASLREKLFVMWGDLEENKNECQKSGLQLEAEGVHPSSWPFECFIQEYGVQARDESNKGIDDQYERMFRICGTRIA